MIYYCMKSLEERKLIYDKLQKTGLPLEKKSHFFMGNALILRFPDINGFNCVGSIWWKNPFHEEVTSLDDFIYAVKLALT